MGLLFPLSVVPSVTWHRNPTNTHFGAPRGGGFPVHGACDLVVPAGTEVLAMEDGRIIRGPYQMFNDPTRLDILTDRSDHRYLYVPQANYKRRNDLLDPTDYLDACLGPGAS